MPWDMGYRDIVISIHALRKESDGQRDVAGDWLVISIHALRKESDMRIAGMVFP